MKRSRRDFYNSYNLALISIILAAAVYVAVAANANPGSLNISPPPRIQNTPLKVQIYPGIDTQTLNADAAVIKSMMGQKTRDQNFADKLLKVVGSQKPFTYSDLSLWLSWVNDLEGETAALIELPRSQTNFLAGQVASLKASFSWVKRVISLSRLNQQSAAIVAQPNYQAFDRLGPIIAFLKVADDEQAAETMLNLYSGKLSQAVNAVSLSNTVNKTDLQADLTTLNADAGAGQEISASISSQIYAGHYTIKEIDDSLATAQRDIFAGLNAATTIVSSLTAN